MLTWWMLYPRGQSSLRNCAWQHWDRIKPISPHAIPVLIHPVCQEEAIPSRKMRG
ncbi:MAG: hypothetical protein RMK18_00410 [Armatimonadota bacterium]|nr:hypothetical protein [Armatimonadota bacterium]